MRTVIRMQISVFELKRTAEKGYSLTPSGSSLMRKPSKQTVLQTLVSNVLATQNLSVSWTSQTSGDAFGLAYALLRSISEAKTVMDEKIETRNNLIVTTENTRTRSILKSVKRETERDTSGYSNAGVAVEFEELVTGWSIAVQPTSTRTAQSRCASRCRATSWWRSNRGCSTRTSGATT